MNEETTVNLVFADNGVKFEDIMARIAAAILEKKEGDDRA